MRSRSWVWATLAAFCVALFVALAPLFVLGPIVAREQYGDLAVFGYVFAAFGGGTIVGSLVAIRWRPRYPMRQGMIFVLIWPVAIALYAAGAPLVLVVPAMVLAGSFIALFDVWWGTALAERIPPDKLSRVTSYDWTVSLGLVPLGYVLAGPAADALGATEVLLGGSVDRLRRVRARPAAARNADARAPRRSGEHRARGRCRRRRDGDTAQGPRRLNAYAVAVRFLPWRSRRRCSRTRCRTPLRPSVSSPE